MSIPKLSASDRRFHAYTAATHHAAGPTLRRTTCGTWGTRGPLSGEAQGQQAQEAPTSVGSSGFSTSLPSWKDSCSKRCACTAPSSRVGRGCNNRLDLVVSKLNRLARDAGDAESDEAVMTMSNKAASASKTVFGYHLASRSLSTSRRLSSVVSRLYSSYSRCSSPLIHLIMSSLDLYSSSRHLLTSYSHLVVALNLFSHLVVARPLSSSRRPLLHYPHALHCPPVYHHSDINVDMK